MGAALSQIYNLQKKKKESKVTGIAIDSLINGTKIYAGRYLKEIYMFHLEYEKDFK